MPAASAAATTSSSRTDPPGWTTAVIPASIASCGPSANGLVGTIAHAPVCASVVAVPSRAAPSNNATVLPGSALPVMVGRVALVVLSPGAPLSLGAASTGKAGADGEHLKGVEKVRAAMDKTKDPAVHATGFALRGELFLAGSNPDGSGSGKSDAGVSVRVSDLTAAVSIRRVDAGRGG